MTDHPTRLAFSTALTIALVASACSLPSFCTAEADQILANDGISEDENAGAPAHYSYVSRGAPSLSPSVDHAFDTSLVDIDFITNIRGLRSVDIRYTAVTSLAPIARALELEVVVADGAPVTTLPMKRLPSLRILNLLHTKVDEEQVERFRHLNPQCTVFHRWTPELRRVTEGAWMRVQNASTFVTVRDLDEVAAFVRRLEVDEARGGSVCLCLGSLSFEFYRGTERVLSLSLHHGNRLRWNEGDGGPRRTLDLETLDGTGAMLTETSAASLAEWLTQFPGTSANWSVVSSFEEAPQTISAGSTVEDRGPPTVIILERGFQVQASTGTLPESCDMTRDRSESQTHDDAWLRGCLTDLKSENPGVHHIVVLARQGISYDVIVRTMDVARGSAERPLFTDVLFGIEWPSGS